MTLQEYDRITDEAYKRFLKYKSIGEVAMLERKEDDFEYWVAVVAAEYAKNELSRKG